MRQHEIARDAKGKAWRVFHLPVSRTYIVHVRCRCGALAFAHDADVHVARMRAVEKHGDHAATAEVVGLKEAQILAATANFWSAEA